MRASSSQTPRSGANHKPTSARTAEPDALSDRPAAPRPRRERPTKERGDGGRTCIACGLRAQPDAFIRLCLVPEGGLQVEIKALKGGRGAYLCPTRACADLAVKKQRIGKALHGNSGVKTGAEVVDSALHLVNHHLQYMLSLCQKAGRIASGADSVEAAVTSGRAACVLVASDLSEGSLDKLTALCRRHEVPQYRLGLTRESLGALLGKGERAAGAVQHGPLAEGLKRDLVLLERLTS